MGYVDVVIYIGGRLRTYPVSWYNGGKRVLCKKKDPDYISLIELYKGFRYLGYRNYSEMYASFSEENIEDRFIVKSGVDMSTVLNMIGNRRSIVFLVNHGALDFDDPICDGYTDSYLIGDELDNAWEETVNMETTILEGDADEGDAGSLGIPSDTEYDSGDDSKCEYYPSSSSEESEFEHGDGEPEPNLDQLENMEGFRHVEEPKEKCDEEQLHSPYNSDDELSKVKKQFSYWNPSCDYEKPIRLEVGLVFTDVKELRKCLREYAIQEGFTYKLKPNESKRVIAKCQANCGWMLRASHCQITEGFRIKTISSVHTCARLHKNWKVTSTWIASKIVKMVRADAEWKVEGIRNHIGERFGVEVSTQQCYRAKIQAVAIIHGEEKKQFYRLRDYCTPLREWNSGSSVYIYSPNLVFARMYVCLAACKRGFVEACRPLIALDGCHLKTSFGGQLLCAIGKDANESMYPIAFAVVEIENGEAWEWFIDLLMEDFGGNAGRRYTFISDQQKGLVGALRKHAGAKHHKFCLRHLYGNFKAKFRGQVLKDLLWRAAVATTEKWFEDAMAEIKKLDEAAYNWLREKDPTQWANHRFDTEAKSDMIMNNIAETFNLWVLDARTKPIRTMCEQIRWMLMNRFVTKQNSLTGHGSKLCPKIQARLNKFKRLYSKYIVHFDGMVHEVVPLSEKRFLVNVKAKTCSCRKWDLTGIPCVHGVAAILFQRCEPKSYVDHYYHVDSLKKAYNHTIHAMPGPDEWKRGPEDDIQPPVCRSQLGRRKKVRRREADEGQTAFNVKRGRVLKKCGSCGGTGHNSRSCQNSVSHPSRAAKARKEADRAKRYRERKKHETNTSQPVRSCRSNISSSQPLPKRQKQRQNEVGGSSSSQPTMTVDNASEPQAAA